MADEKIVTSDILNKNNQDIKTYINNKTTLTSEQLEAINSGINSSLVNKISQNETKINNLLQQPDYSEAGNVGTPQISIDSTGKLVFKNIKGDKGSIGATGNGIESISKTNTTDNIDTYTITYTNGDSTIFTVTNGINGVKGENGNDGIGIKSITKTSTEGLVDTYTITYTNDTTTTFKVTNGVKGSDGITPHIDEISGN